MCQVADLQVGRCPLVVLFGFISKDNESTTGVDVLLAVSLVYQRENDNMLVCVYSLVVPVDKDTVSAWFYQR